jgi:hypothetical protein
MARYYTKPIKLTPEEYKSAKIGFHSSGAEYLIVPGKEPIFIGTYAESRKPENTKIETITLYPYGIEHSWTEEIDVHTTPTESCSYRLNLDDLSKGLITWVEQEAPFETDSLF